MPGPTLSGKTHLVRELVKAGATYYSDEYAVLDARSRLHPYAQPLAVREHGRNEAQTPRAVEEFGGVAGRECVPVALVVATVYREGTKWQPRRLSQSEGLFALLANTISARRHPRKVMETLREVTLRARSFKGPRGEAGATADSILELLN